MWLQDMDFATTIRWLADHLGVAPQSGFANATPFVGGSSARPRDSSKSASTSVALVRRMTTLARDAMMRIQMSHFDQLQRELGVPAGCLRSLCVGYSSDHRATTWPMRTSDGRITGIRLRGIDSPAKWSVKGSVAGLFLSRDHKPNGDRLVIVEGASDMATAIDLGLTAIGRPSCRGSVQIVIDYIRRYGFKCVTIVSDNDVAGLAGSKALASDLAKSGIDSRIISPPAEFGDLRSWYQRGIGRQEVLGRPVLSEHPGVGVATQLSFSFDNSVTAMPFQ